MFRNVFFFLLFVVLNCLYFPNCYAQQDLQVQIANHKGKITFQKLDKDRLLVSVLDAEDNPVKGLKGEDFIVHKGTRQAKIVSAESFETTKEVPLNIVLVVDNSFSMKQRQAVKPLLSALEEFFKTVRPIDNVHGVVFSRKETMKVGKYQMHTKTIRSNDVSELREFFREAFSGGMTGGTYLYEAMAAGVDIVHRMPYNDQKFMVVFSDGADLNSDIKSSIVEAMAMGINNFEAYCVDYMPRPRMHPLPGRLSRAPFLR